MQRYSKSFGTSLFLNGLKLALVIRQHACGTAFGTSHNSSTNDVEDEGNFISFS